MRLSNYKIEQDTDHVISWNDFIKFFSSNCIAHPNLINVHFRPISRQCGLCHRQIDYMLKSETMDEDSEYLINLVKSKMFVEGGSVVLPENLEFGHRNKANGSLRIWFFGDFIFLLRKKDIHSYERCIIKITFAG